MRSDELKYDALCDSIGHFALELYYQHLEYLRMVERVRSDIISLEVLERKLNAMDKNNAMLEKRLRKMTISGEEVKDETKN